VDFDPVWTFHQEILSIQIIDSGIKILLEDFSLYFLPFNHPLMALAHWAIWDASTLKKKPLIIDSSEEFDNYPVIYMFKSPNLNNLMIMSGSNDNSFHFFKENKQITQEFHVFHKKPISYIIVIEKRGFLLCGSKDCRISLWEFNFETLILKADPWKKAKNVFFGHEGEILMMDYNEQTDLLLSIDKEGLCLLFNLKSRLLMRRIRTGEQQIFMGLIHPYGLLAVFSKEKSFLFK